MRKGGEEDKGREEESTETGTKKRTIIVESSLGARARCSTNVTTTGPREKREKRYGTKRAPQRRRSERVPKAKAGANKAAETGELPASAVHLLQR